MKRVAELMLKEGIFKEEKPDAIFGMHVTNAAWMDCTEARSTWLLLKHSE